MSTIRPGVISPAFHCKAPVAGDTNFASEPRTSPNVVDIATGQPWFNPRTFFDPATKPSKKQLALACAKAGLHVFRLAPGTKEPLADTRGFKDATTDLEQIAAWWDETPDANIGVYAGASRLLVIDVDVREGKPGMESLTKLASDYNLDVDKLPYVRTPSGGRHYYIAIPADGLPVPSGKDRRYPGIDFKSHVGYVVAAGSWTREEPGRSCEGFYEWVGVDEPPEFFELPEVPQALIDARGEARKRDPNVGGLHPKLTEQDWDRPENIARGIEWLKHDLACGAESTFDAMCGLQDFAISEDKRVELITEYWNPYREVSRSEEYIREKSRNASIYAQDPAGSKLPEAVFAGVEQEEAEPLPDNSGEQTRKVLDGLSSRYAVLTGQNAGRILDYSEPTAPRVLPVDRFHNVLAQVKVSKPGGKPGETAPASRVWLVSSRRNNFHEIVFEPPGSHARVRNSDYNAWQGLRVQPEEGDAHLPLLSHIEENVCSGNEQHYNWLLDWLADLVQDPGNKPGTAVVLEGIQGCGKTVVGDAAARLVAPYSLKVASSEQITGRFNAHFAGKIFMQLEEATWGGEVKGRGALKNLITSDTLFVENKGVDGYSISNHARLFATSNEDRPAPIEHSDRRWFHLHVRPDRANDTAYFGPIWEAMNNGKLLPNLLHFLLNRTYDKAALRNPPMTAAKGEQISRNLPPPARWLHECLAEDEPEFWSDGSAVPKEEVFLAFQNWEIVNRRTRTDKQQFWKELKKILGGDLREKKARNGSDRMRVVDFPPLNEARDLFAAYIGCAWSDLADDEFEIEGGE